MPLEPIDSLGGFTASPGLPLQREEGGDTALATVGKVAAPLAIGAGLLLAPEFTIPALVAGGAAASYADPEAAGAAFRTENTIGSVLSSDEMGVDDRRIDPQFDPWAEIQGTPYEAYYEQFGRAANRGHFDAIKSDIDRENKDRDTLAKSGIVGMGATMAAGVLDLPSLIPGAVVLRSAKGGVSMLKSAAGTAAAGTGAAVASETVLQQSQQLRTAGESATVIAGSAVLSGLLGAGLGRRMARQEFDGLAARVERDFTVPGPGEPDPFMPGSFKPSVEAVAGASEKARSVADAIRETAEEILPAQVKVQVVDSLGPVGDDGLFGLRAKRYAAPEIETPDQIGDALKTIRETVEEAQSAPLKGRFAPDDLRQRFIAYKKADTDLRAAMIGGLDPEDALTRYAKLRGEAEGIVNDLRKTDARINRDIEKDMKAREGKEQFSLRGFYSPAIRSAESISMKKGTGEQFWKQITKTPGVRKDELEWMGLEEFLAGKKPITKDEVLAFMRAHQVELDEKALGDVDPAELQKAAKELYDKPYDSLRPYEQDLVKQELGSSTKFHGHKVPAGENYRELLIRLPKLEGKYTSKHFEDQEIVHLRVDDRTGPNGEKVLFINELQSDLHQAGRQKGYKKNFSADQRASMSARTNELVKQSSSPDFASKTDAEKAAIKAELEDLYAKGAAETYGSPNAPFKGDLWLELALKRALLYASENGYDAVSWARSDQIAKAVGAKQISDIKWQVTDEGLRIKPTDDEWRVIKAVKGASPLKPALDLIAKRVSPDKSQEIANAIARGQTSGDISGFTVQNFGMQRQYDEAMAAFLDRYTKKWGAKVEEENLGVADAEGNNLDISLMTDEQIADAAASLHATNPILRVTPQMRASVMEGQPLGVRQTSEGVVAEGKFEPEKLLITIAADALDPAKTLRHESIHALKSMGLFTGKDWGTLEAAAKKGGWLETHNVRALYEGVYSKQGASRFSFAGPKADNADLKALARAKTMSKAGSTREAIWQETGWFQGVDKKWRFEISDAEASVAARAGSLGDVLDHPELKEAYPSLIKNTRVENTGTPGEGGLFMSPGLDRPKIIRAIDRLTGYQPNRIALDRDAGKSTLLHEVQHGIQEREGFHPGGDFGDPLYHRRAGEVEARNVQRRMAMTPEERRATPPWKTQDVADEAQILGKSLFSLRGEGKAPSGASNPKLEALLLEEAIAEQFSLWRQGAIQVKGTIAKLFERIQQFLEATGNALRGRGFQTADDVFAAVRSGEVASRAPGASPAAGAIPAAGLGRATSAGASAVERADDTLKTALGLEKAFYWQDPMLRLQNSLSPASKRHVQELAETPLAYDKNELGQPTAPGGSEMGAPGAVETRIKFWQGALADAVQAVDQGFMKYRTGHAKRFTGETVLLNMRDTVYGTDALTYPQFKQEIAKALRRGDEHQIPEVAGAARIWRQKVLDPLKDEAIEHEMLPEGVTPETAPSYLNRLYNKDKIIAERDQFKTIVADWLEGQESINRGVRTRLAPMLERIESADAEIAKLDAGISRGEARLKELEARKEETDRVQQFAFKRALERREPIETLQRRIADLGEQVQRPLDDLASLRDIDSRITDARQIARAMQEDDGGDLAAQLADVAELEESVDVIIAKAEASIERIAEDGDLPLPRAEGRYTGPHLDADEIETVASSWRFVREMKARGKPEGLTAFVVRMGGVEDPGGDVLAMIGRSKDRPGLIRRSPDDAGPSLPGMGGGSRPNTLDAMALRAWENGFFPSSTERPTVDDLLDALREDFTGNPQVRAEDEAYFIDVERAGKLADDLASRGIDPDAFRRESQIRLFLGQAPRDALAGEAGSGLKALRLVKKQLADTIEPYRQRISALTKDARKRERSESLRQSERGVFATQSRNRGRSLADRIFSERGKLEKRRADLAAKEASLADAQKAIEDEVVKYQGKSAKEAKSALEAREEAEAVRGEKRQIAAARREELQRQIASEENALVRTGPDQKRELALVDARKELATLERQSGDPKRLRGADKPVLSAARKIAAQLDKEPGEITALADEIIDRILGTPDGRLPYDAHKNSATAHGASVDARGPLAARQFMIPDAAIERYLENDIEVLGRAYVRTMAADVEMTKRFGSVDMVDQIKEIAEDYARLSAQAKTPEARRKLHKQRDNDIRDLAAIRDRMRGTYALPKNPDGLLVRSGRVINSLNYMRMLGGMTISAIPDTARTVMVHGLMRTAGDGLLPLLRNWSGARLAMTEVKLAGTALDMVLDSRAMQIADIMDDFGRHSKFERAIQAGARNFGVISLMAPWNAAMKQFSGLVTMTRMLRATERIAAGKGRPKEVAMLAAGGISEANARKIAAQFAKHGSKEGGVWRANTAAWEERSAIEAFRAALVRDVDRIIVTPGQERPLWMSTETGRLIGQFKSFSISAMQRVLISGLQQRDMATLNGAILMVALGGLASVLRAKVGGQPAPDLSDRQKQGQFLVEAIDRSGLTGWMMEANSMTEKLTRGAVGLSAITGKPVSRYASRNISSALLGPTAGTMQDFTRVVGAAASGEWNQSDSRVMRRLIPYNNIFYLRQMFDEAEAGINGFLGVPKPAGAKR